MEEKVTLEVTAEQYKTILIALMEIPAKYSISIVQELQKQVKDQTKDEVLEEEKTE
jgi:hypothetical protein